VQVTLWWLGPRNSIVGDRVMALPRSEPLDVQLGRRGSGEQQAMNLKSQI
jgi:hypothetical protein